MAHYGSMVMVYLPTWMVDFYGFHVAKYTSPMDTVGGGLWKWWFTKNPQKINNFLQIQVMCS